MDYLREFIPLCRVCGNIECKMNEHLQNNLANLCQRDEKHTKVRNVQDDIMWSPKGIKGEEEWWKKYIGDFVELQNIASPANKNKIYRNKNYPGIKDYGYKKKVLCKDTRNTKYFQCIRSRYFGREKEPKVAKYFMEEYTQSKCASQHSDGNNGRSSSESIKVVPEGETYLKNDID